MDESTESSRQGSAWSPQSLAEINQGFQGQDAQTLLAWAVATFASQICLATSFGPQTIVLIHMLSRLRPDTTVFYLDTSLLFPETYALRDELSRRVGMRFVRVASELTVEEQHRDYGPRLWARDPHRCCHLRKVLPLRRFLASRQAWITGLRRRICR